MDDDEPLEEARRAFERDPDDAAVREAWLHALCRAGRDEEASELVAERLVCEAPWPKLTRGALAGARVCPWCSRIVKYALDVEGLVRHMQCGDAVAGPQNRVQEAFRRLAAAGGRAERPEDGRPASVHVNPIDALDTSRPGALVPDASVQTLLTKRLGLAFHVLPLRWEGRTLVVAVAELPAKTQRAMLRDIWAADELKPLQVGQQALIDAWEACG